MTKKYFSVLGIILSVISLSVLTATQGYSDDLFKATLIGASASYSNEVEAKISIKDTGKVELSIKGLRSSSDNELVNQNSILVIETEVSESAKTYSKSFTITDGKAEEEFTLEDLDKDDKLEITSVVINKVTSTTPTPTVTASPTSSPTATPIATASPTPESSPTTAPTATASPTPTGTAIYSLVIKAQTSADDAILVPGGIISESTTGATPTPTVTASPTPGASPTATPAVIEAGVTIRPETFNLKSKGNFKAFITLPSPYSVNDIVTDTVVCEGATAIDGKVDSAGRRFVATFNIQELDLGFDIKVHKGRDDKKVKVELTVSGELNDGTKFEGSDEVRIKGEKKEDDDDDD